MSITKIILLCGLAVSPLLSQPDPAMLRNIFEQHLAEEQQAHGEFDVRTAAAARDLGLFLRGRNDTAGAHAALSRAIAIDEKVFGPESPRTLADLADLASVSPLADAAKLFERASKSPDAAASARALVALGEMHAGQGDREGAARYWHRAVAKMPPDTENTARILNVLAQVVQPAEAIPLLRRALVLDRRILGATHPEVGATGQLLAAALIATAKPADALPFAKEAYAILSGKLGPDHPRTAEAADTLANVLRANARFTEAEKFFRQAIDIDDRVLGPQHPSTLAEIRRFADFLRQRGRTRDAAELERRLVVNVAR
jgi:tetratricopeptide (TPR) repeat protein